MSLPVSAIEFSTGIISHAGLAHSVLSLSQQSTFNSNKPFFQLGLGITAWIVKDFGIQTGLQYGWYNYDYDHIPYGGEWDCRNLIIPVDLVYGIRIGSNKIVIGGGFAVCKQLAATGKVGFITPVKLPDELLETTFGPGLLLGIEFHVGRMVLFPSFKYTYGLDGVSDEFPTIDGDVSNHYLLMGLGILYRL
jgi:hypothetical protein